MRFMVKTLKILTALIYMLQDCNLNLKVKAFDVFTLPKEGEWWHRESVQSQIQKFGSANAEPKK